MEQWERWVPLNNLPSKLYNDLFVDNSDGITLEFSDESNQKIVWVNFREGVLSYRNTDEGSLLKMLKYLNQQYGITFYSEWPLFKVKNSGYLTWFQEQSCGVYESSEIVHYVFLTPHDVIEILSDYSPSVRIK
ncbi:hypothetical protein [Paludifilum halophilum]|uniref:Uncharacterized protein n=1 Tax=Paludifilum halophilum TaxID=1642702 RepID=A0A235B1E5_9BACL|nr:hypothetical protein [Paludifilum halophilum]OYD06128.1 hypothetical protein CHM34_17900 [Paludifilum halophilum]